MSWGVPHARRETVGLGGGGRVCSGREGAPYGLTAGNASGGRAVWCVRRTSPMRLAQSSETRPKPRKPNALHARAHTTASTPGSCGMPRCSLRERSPTWAPPSATGAFVIDAKSSSVTLWSLSSSGGGAGLGAELSSDAPANIVVHLYLNASAEWRETRNGRGRAAYE